MRAEVEELYSRGKYKLAFDRKRDGTLRSPFLQIVWYDEAAGRVRQRSTGTEDVEQAENELDALYLKRERGQAVCPTCGQTMRAGARHLVTTAVADYLVAREGKPSIEAMRARLSHITSYLSETDQLAIACEDVDEDWIEAFREWAAEVPIVSTGGKTRMRTAGTIEGSVTMLAAAINFAHHRKDSLFPAGFTAKKAEEVSRTPAFRADIATLARMFDYCVNPEVDESHYNRTYERRRSDRANLHRFLQVSVATWARPDAAHDVSTDRARDQWHSNARALNLNPKGRPQTKKHRPIVPIARQMAPLLDGAKGFYITVDSVKTAFEVMLDHLGLPRDGETGLKLIRRSIAHLARQKLGERDWVEGQIMLGHRKLSTSDTYAPFDVGYLSRALGATEDIITDIEKRVPGAFSVAFSPRGTRAEDIFTGVTPDEANSQTANFPQKRLVGERGFEPPAPASRRQCSTRLSYSPTEHRSLISSGADRRSQARRPYREGFRGRQASLFTIPGANVRRRSSRPDARISRAGCRCGRGSSRPPRCAASRRS
jgi:hypothetical protein